MVLLDMGQLTKIHQKYACFFANLGLSEHAEATFHASGSIFPSKNATNGSVLCLEGKPRWF